MSEGRSWEDKCAGTHASALAGRAAGTAAWACTREDLTEPSQNFVCRQKKGRNAAQGAGQPSTPLQPYTEAPSESRPAEQQRFLSSSETRGGSRASSTHNAWGYPARYQLQPRGAGRKRVSIPAEPRFRRGPFPPATARARPCHALDTRVCGGGLWLPSGERDCGAVTLRPCGIAKDPSSCLGSC